MLRLAFLLIPSCVYMAAAWQDASRRIIANGLSITVLVLGLLRLAWHGDFHFAVATVLASCVGFVVMLLLFGRGWLGGGDVKLIAATVMLVGIRDLPTFLLVMSAAGAVLAASLWAMRRARPSGDAVAAVPVTVPYGVAISVGAIYVLVEQYIEGFM